MKTMLNFGALVLMAACSTERTPMKKSAPTIELERLQELTLPQPLTPGRGAHVSAASGLVQRNGTLYFIADDENALFAQTAGQLLHAIPLTSLRLAVEPTERKAAKADLESLTLLSDIQWPPHGALLAWPSGSTPQRTRAYVLPFKDDDTFATPIVRDATSLLRSFGFSPTELNLEGVVFSAAEAIFVQRGNAGGGRNGFFRLPLGPWLGGLQSGHWPELPAEFTDIPLGALQGVPLTFTDATSSSRGILALAVAEATDSTYADGAVSGSVLVHIVDGVPKVLGIFNLPVKLEGLWLEKENPDGSLQILLVDDADDPQKASALYRAVAVPR